MNKIRRVKRATLVAIDLDGTLLRDDKVISEFSLATLRMLSQAGAQIAFVTGRRERIAMPVLAPVNFPAWAVLNNGPVGMTLPDRRRVFTRYISAPVVQDVIACLRAIGRPPVVVIDPLQSPLTKGDEGGCSASATENRKPKTENCAAPAASATENRKPKTENCAAASAAPAASATENRKPKTENCAAPAAPVDLVMDRALLQIPLYQDYAARHNGFITLEDDIAQSALLARTVAMFLCEPTDAVAGVRAHLTNALGDCIEHRALDNLEYIRDHRIVEMVEPGLTKWNGVEMLREALELDDARVIAFGDDHNDLDMLTEAHMSFAPRNAIQAAKQAADDIIPGNNDDGVAVTLRKLFPEVFG
jgi:hydroxymethylpyrimidine pyrophosphatase-like HAD family hydrolase